MCEVLQGSQLDDLTFPLPETYFCHILALKACVCYFLSNFYFSLNDSPSKTMKNDFYFM